MADLLFDAQGTPASPSAGTSLLYPDSSSKQWTTKNENGRCLSLDGVIRNWNTADVVANAVDTYLTGSSIAVPQHLLQAGATFKWRFIMTKTNAGTVAPIWNIRVGTAGTTADASRLLFTGTAQTAAVDTGFVEISAVLRSIGASGVMAGGLNLVHNLATTGFATLASVVAQATSAGFDTTTSNLIIGVSVTPGTSAIWTHQVVVGEMSNM